MNRKILCLRDVDIYAGISEEELISLTDQALERTYNQGHIFYNHGELHEKVYVLKTGEVELIREEGEKTVVLETLFPGDVFGDFGMGKANHTARIIKKAYICETPTNEFLNIVKAHPQMALQLMQELGKKIQFYEEKLAKAQAPAKDKLLAEIIYLEEKHNQKIFGKFFNLPFRISHQKLADKTGLNRVTITKLMQQLQREDLIMINRETGVIKVL